VPISLHDSLRDEALDAARAENLEVAATADLWIREGIELDELPYVIMQLARVNDYLMAVIEADETPLGRELARKTALEVQASIKKAGLGPSVVNDAIAAATSMHAEPDSR
jgi:hypothetical protein